MSYGIKYRCEFRKRDETSCKYEILKQDYSGAIESLKATGTPVILSQQGTSVDPLTPILGSSLKASFIALGQLATDRQYQEFIYARNREYRIDYYEATVLIWQGYVLPDNYQEQYIGPPYVVTIMATDQLGDLRNFKYQKKIGNLITTWTNIDYDTFTVFNEKILCAITDGSAVAGAKSNTFEVKEGDQVLVTVNFTNNSGTVPSIGIRSNATAVLKSNSVNLTAGNNLITLTATEDVTDAVIYWNNTAAAANWKTGVVLVQFIDLIKTGWQRDSVIIADCLKQTGLSLEIRENINLTDIYQESHRLSTIKSNQEVFLTQEGGLEEPWDCYKVLSEVLRTYGARVEQVDNHWFILRIDNQRAQYDVRRYDANGVYIDATTFDPIKEFTTATNPTIVRPVEQSGILTSLPGWQYMVMRQVFGYINLIRNSGFENSNKAVRLRRWDRRGDPEDATRIIKFWQARASLTAYYVSGSSQRRETDQFSRRVTYSTSTGAQSGGRTAFSVITPVQDKQENLALILDDPSTLGYLYSGATASDQHLAYEIGIRVTAYKQWFRIKFDTKVLANAAGITAGIKTGLRIWIDNDASGGNNYALRLKAGSESVLSWVTDASNNIVTGVPITENDTWKTFELVTETAVPVSGILYIELHRHYMASGSGAVISESHYDNVELYTAKEEAIVPADEVTEIEYNADNNLIPEEIVSYFGDGYGTLTDAIADDLYLYRGIKKVIDAFGNDNPSNGAWINVGGTYVGYRPLLGWLQEYLKISRQTPSQIFRGSIIGKCSFLSVYKDVSNGNRLFPTNIVQSYNPREDIWQIEAIELKPAAVEIEVPLLTIQIEGEVVIPTIDISEPATPPTVQCEVAVGAGFTINDLGGAVSIGDDQLNFQFDGIDGFSDSEGADVPMDINIYDASMSNVYSGSVWTRDGQTVNETVTIGRDAVAGDAFTVECGSGV